MNTTTTDRDALYLARTKTGKKLHVVRTGSSVSRCGHWFRGLPVCVAEVTAESIDLYRDRICEKCYATIEKLDTLRG